jgi:hypothetical protein
VKEIRIMCSKAYCCAPSSPLQAQKRRVLAFLVCMPKWRARRAPVAYHCQEFRKEIKRLAILLGGRVGRNVGRSVGRSFGRSIATKICRCSPCTAICDAYPRDSARAEVPQKTAMLDRVRYLLLGVNKRSNPRRWRADQPSTVDGPAIAIPSLNQASARVLYCST